MEAIGNPRLLHFYTWISREGLPEPEHGWLQSIADAGYRGIQFGLPAEESPLTRCRELNLDVCGSGRVDSAADAGRLAGQAVERGMTAVTLHVGTGCEDDDTAASLLDSILTASAKYKVPLYVETHRATLFQDMWRSVRFVERFPELRFNGDFSHWYTGLEMVYGDFEKKLDFMKPVLERVSFMHGRIGSPGCMQVALGDLNHALTLPFVQHFRQIWTRVFHYYFANPTARPEFVFAVELLPASIYYAREFEGAEESNRWEQSLVLREIADGCLSQATRAITSRGLKRSGVLETAKQCT